MKKKACLDCKEDKEVKEFYSRGNGSHFSYCKTCVKVRVKQWDKTHIMRRREINADHMRRSREEKSKCTNQIDKKIINGI